MVGYIIKGIQIINKAGQLLVHYKALVRTTSELLLLLDINVTDWLTGHDGHEF